jgi:ankyrin repeat protein
VKVRGGDVNDSPLFADLGSFRKTKVALLHSAALGGSTKVARWLLDNGAELDARTDLHGLTPLHYAANYGRYDLVSLLVGRGANVNARAEDGTTPLHLAIASRRLQGQNSRFSYSIGGDREKTIDGLLRLSADPTIADKWGKTTIMAAASKRDLPLIQRLHALGVDLNAVTTGAQPRNAKDSLRESTYYDEDRERLEPVVMKWLEENMKRE